ELSAELHLDTEPREVADEVVDEQPDALPTRHATGERELAAELRRALDEPHTVAELGQFRCCTHSRGTPADDEPVLATGRTRQRRPRLLTACARIDRARHGQAAAAAAEASL